MGTLLFCFIMLGVVVLIIYGGWYYGKNQNDPKKYFEQRRQQDKDSVISDSKLVLGEYYMDAVSPSSIGYKIPTIDKSLIEAQT